MFYKIAMALKKMETMSKTGGRVFIRGAGFYGTRVLKELTKMGIAVSAFIDMNHIKEVDGIDVLDPDSIYGLEKGTFFVCVAVSDPKDFKAIRLDMKAHGLNEGDDFADFGINADGRMDVPVKTINTDGRTYVDFMDVPVKTYDRKVIEMKAALDYFVTDTENLTASFNPNDKKNIFGNIGLTVTTHCTLSCANCIELLSVMKRKNFDAEQMIEDVDKLLSVSYLQHLSILGGEVFIYPQWEYFLELLAQMRNIDNVGHFLVFTNATVLPPESTWLKIKQLNKVSVITSTYKNIRGYHSEYKDICETLGIGYRNTDYSHGSWTDFGDISKKRNRTEEELRHLYSICRRSLCNKLFDGKLYGCPRSSINEGRIMPYSEFEFVDVRKTPVEELEKKIYDFAYKKEYLELCDYCDGCYPGAKEIPAGE